MYNLRHTHIVPFLVLILFFLKSFECIAYIFCFIFKVLFRRKNNMNHKYDVKKYLKTVLYHTVVLRLEIEKIKNVNWINPEWN